MLRALDAVLRGSASGIPKRFALLCLAGCWTGANAASSAAADGVLQRLMPGLAPQFALKLEQRADGRDYFRIGGSAGHIEVRAATMPTLLAGVNEYLKTVAHLQVSTNGVRLGPKGFVLPAPPAPIEKPAHYPWRYALNENTDGYTTPYWDEARWRREIDILALHGVNAVLVERGMDAVLYRTFRDFGYGDEEIRAWITTPAHQNWQLMGNMCCFNGPIAQALLDKRAASGRRIAAMLRELGIEPVFQGYYGVVPADFAKKHPGAHVIEQGDWGGFARPGWIDPRDPWFAKIAEAFYRYERELYGDAAADIPKTRDARGLPPLGELYDMEIFQEGGTAGDVPVGDGAKAVQAALLRAHPNARWMMMAWQKNPLPELVDALDPAHTLIIDIEQGRIARENRDMQFKGIPWLYGGLWQFGGRTTFGAPLYDYAVRLPRMASVPGNHIAGVGLFTEGLDTNPFAFDLYYDMAWRDAPVDLAAWTRDYAQRRYGGNDAHAERAWQIIAKTAYGFRADVVAVNDAGDRDAAHDSLFAAVPSLTITHAASWSPPTPRYDANEFRSALAELLQVAAPLRTTETYRYDIVDVARQTLANESRRLLPLIEAAYEAKDRPRFKALTGEWTRDIQLQESLLRTNDYFLLGAWLARVPPWASSQQELAQLDYDARSIMTTWSDRRSQDARGLWDYANRDWAGLTADYYLPRWRMYFASLERSLATGKPPETIDWYAVGERFNRSMKTYPAKAEGDPWRAALAIARALDLAPDQADAASKAEKTPP
ncbi:MAG: alpha-N-acetylglucosaminidase [Rudaea sp.]|uniref:alpha-N-acetylglucosaminidase n=1 Tax=Rudaea sp. TaxID=2136325 RepID=UPI0039E3B335